MSKHPIPKPVWWKNTYFWIAGILVVIAFVGLFWGSEAIRDPGQRRENGLTLIYLGGAVVMLINGLISHKQTVQSYSEQMETGGETK